MLFVGDDWAEGRHDVEIVDETGRVLARRRLPGGLEGVTRLHALVAEQMPKEWADLEPGAAAGRVKMGIETDRGPWVGALVAAGSRCSGSTRSRWPATASGTRPRGRSRMRPMRTCSPRSSDRAHQPPDRGGQRRE
jgi:hypothetical protein